MITTFVIVIIISFIDTLFFNNKFNSSSVICVGTQYNRTCLYKNIFYIKGEWTVIYIPNNRIKCVAIRSRSSNICFKPIVKKNFVKYKKKIKGLSTYFGLFFERNIGHLLFDDLYSIYLSMLKFNYHMNPVNMIISKSNNKWKNNKAAKIFEQFSMNKLIYESDIEREVILIETLVVGLGHHCQRCVNKEYAIAGGTEYNAIWWMRERMYYVYNITQCMNRYAIIVHNKRYTYKEINMLYNLIEVYNQRLYILYIDWKKYKDFFKQLKILSCTNIYISGPGTGLLNFPFISDPGIIINLGGLFRGCPSFMEQYIEEGSMHYISLYYPSNKRIYGLKKNEISLLIDKAIDILNNWNYYKSQHISNLNIEGKIYKTISRKYPDLMNKFLLETDWAKENGVGVWAEKLIYFPYCYNISYIVKLVFNEASLHVKKLGCKVSYSHKTCV